MGPAIRLGLAGSLAVALALRLFFVLTPHGVLDADEAIVGLMGRHVLRGEFPIFYYGQSYMGSLEAYLAGLAFGGGGASPLVLKLVCLALALVLVGLTSELGRRILGPGPGVVAGLLVALPPLFLTVWSLKARGGFIGTLVLGALVLLLAHRTVEATGRRRACAALVLGLVAGLGWWTCQLVVSYLAAAGLLVVRGAGWVAGLRVLSLAAAAFLVGSLPMWLHGWFGRPGTKSVWATVDPATAARQLGQVFTIGLPALLGPGGLWPAGLAIETLTAPLLAFYGLAWVALLRARVCAWRGEPGASPATGAALDAIVALPVIAMLACGLSSFGWFVSEPRYLLPVAAVVPLVVAALLAALWRRGWRAAATGLGTAILAANLAGHLLAPWTAVREAPYSLEAALAFLEARGIPVVATTYWIGPRLSFESGERVVGVSIRGASDRYPPYSVLARRTDRLAYALLGGTADVGGVEERLETLGITHERTSLGELVILHDLRLPGLDRTPPGLFFDALERLPLLEARLRIATAYEAGERADRAIPYLEAALDAGLPPGSDGVDRLVALYRTTGRSANAAALAALRVEAFTPARPREVDFGDAIRLLGYTLSGSAVRAGDRLDLTCFWSTRHTLNADFLVGVRLSDGTRRVSGDFGPVAGAYPTTWWQPGEVVRHTSEMAIPTDLPPGRYAVRIRLWDSQGRQPAPRPRETGEATRTDWLTLTEIEVQPPA